MDIKGVLGLKKGDIVENLEAQIDGVWESKVNGKFKSQSIKIKDSTSEIYVSLQFFEIPKEKKGEQILIKKGTVNVYFSAKNKVNVWGINIAKADDIVIGEPVVATPEEEPPTESHSDSKSRSMALAYAKDLCCAGKIEEGNILVKASIYAQYIDTGVIIEPVVCEEANASEIPFGD